MKIELATLKRIAKAEPTLTLAQFVTVWSEKIADQKREIERERLAGKRATTANTAPTNANIEQQPPTYEQRESELYAFAKTICGARCGGLVTDLLKQHGRDLAAVRAIFERAQQTSDPKAFVAGSIRKQANGARPSVVDAADRLIAAEKVRGIDGDGPLLDLTPTSSRTS